MKITLLQASDLYICAKAIRTCWQSQGKSDSTCSVVGDEDIVKDININEVDFEDASNIKIGEEDKALIYRIGNKFKHSSTLEHIYYSFYIEGVSRALLQELARHRIASPTVKSTRYTLKELKNEKPFCTNYPEYDKSRVEKYCVLTGDPTTDLSIALSLDMLRGTLEKGIANDIAKYCLPEAYKTSLSWSLNARSLQNFLSLRTSKSALWEIRDLAYAIYDALPEEHKYLFEDYVS